MFLGVGISRPAQWRPGYEKGKGCFRMWWLVFEAVAIKDEFSLEMCRAHARWIRQDLDDGNGIAVYRDIDKPIPAGTHIVITGQPAPSQEDPPNAKSPRR